MNEHWRIAAVLSAMGALLVGCPGDDTDDAAACLPALTLACTPAYEPPTYDAIYDNILRRTCGAPATGTQCHGANGLQSNLILADREQAYDSLLGVTDGIERVIPGDPECSPLVQRTESDDPAFRMPRGGPALEPSELCVIRQWIANGAKR